MTIRLIDRPSPNFDERPKEAEINVLVLHYTGMKTLKEALDRLVNQVSQVSTHYVISQSGDVYSMVEETKRAWHAGVSHWRGIIQLNAHSIGIELENPGHEFGYKSFPDSQMNSLKELCDEILSRHPIPARNVIGHSDIAPRRKQDPGELFDWKWLADQGIGLWPNAASSIYMQCNVEVLLSALGYEVDNISATLSAFQRHYLPSRITGQADGLTCTVLNSLVELVG